MHSTCSFLRLPKLSNPKTPPRKVTGENKRDEESRTHIPLLAGRKLKRGDRNLKPAFYRTQKFTLSMVRSPYIKEKTTVHRQIYEHFQITD